MLESFHDTTMVKTCSSYSQYRNEWAGHYKLLLTFFSPIQIELEF